MLLQSGWASNLCDTLACSPQGVKTQEFHHKLKCLLKQQHRSYVWTRELAFLSKAVCKTTCPKFMVFHILLNLIRILAEESTAVGHNRGDYSDAQVCNTGGLVARLLKECPFLGKATSIDKLAVIKKDNICLFVPLEFSLLI